MKKILCFLLLLFFQFHLYGDGYLSTIDCGTSPNPFSPQTEIQQPLEDEDPYATRNQARTVQQRLIQFPKFTHKNVFVPAPGNDHRHPAVILSRTFSRTLRPVPLIGLPPHETFCVFLI